MSGATGASGRGRGRRGGGGPVRRFPRAARINEVLRQVLAEEIERLVDTDERLTLLTVTAVETDRDLRRATLLFSRLGPTEIEALSDARARLQATVARQVRLKWTPLLSFEQDPAIIDGQRIEDILRHLAAEQARADRSAPLDAATGAPVDPAEVPVAEEGPLPGMGPVPGEGPTSESGVGAPPVLDAPTPSDGRDPTR